MNGWMDDPFYLTDFYDFCDVTPFFSPIPYFKKMLISKIYLSHLVLVDIIENNFISVSRHIKINVHVCTLPFSILSISVYISSHVLFVVLVAHEEIEVWLLSSLVSSFIII